MGVLWEIFSKQSGLDVFYHVRPIMLCSEGTRVCASWGVLDSTQHFCVQIRGTLQCGFKCSYLSTELYIILDVSNLQCFFLLKL